MLGSKDERNRELKRATQSCSKLTDIFKNSKPSEESKELSGENQMVIKKDVTEFSRVLLIRSARTTFIDLQWNLLKLTYNFYTYK